MSRGEPPDSVYVIIEGEVEILGETPAGEFIVAVVGRNELQGEMGVIHEHASGRYGAREDASARCCALPRTSSCACSPKTPVARCT